MNKKQKRELAKLRERLQVLCEDVDLLKEDVTNYGPVADIESDEEALDDIHHALGEALHMADILAEAEVRDEGGEDEE